MLWDDRTTIATRDTEYGWVYGSAFGEDPNEVFFELAELELGERVAHSLGSENDSNDHRTDYRAWERAETIWYRYAKGWRV